MELTKINPDINLLEFLGLQIKEKPAASIIKLTGTIYAICNEDDLWEFFTTMY